MIGCCSRIKGWEYLNLIPFFRSKCNSEFDIILKGCIIGKRVEVGIDNFKIVGEGYQFGMELAFLIGDTDLEWPNDGKII